MIFTSARVIRVEREHLLAAAGITLCECFVLREMRLIRGRKHKHVAIPVCQTKGGWVFEEYTRLLREE